MDYWNVFAQRIGDRNHTGVLSVEGFGSPFRATSGRVEFSTAIQPASGAALPQILAIDNPAIGPRVVLFWTHSGAQYPGTYLTPVVVE